MVFTQEQWDKIYKDIMTKISNNNERQAYIRPSDYGFGTKSENTNEFLEALKKQLKYKRAAIIGKDLIDIVLD